MPASSHVPVSSRPSGATGGNDNGNGSNSGGGGGGGDGDDPSRPRGPVKRAHEAGEDGPPAKLARAASSSSEADSDATASESSARDSEEALSDDQEYAVGAGAGSQTESEADWSHGDADDPRAAAGRPAAWLDAAEARRRRLASLGVDPNAADADAQAAAARSSRVGEAFQATLPPPVGQPAPRPPTDGRGPTA